MMLARRSLTALLAALCVVCPVSCGSDAAGPSVPQWFDRARAAVAAKPPTSDVMQIDPSAPCALVGRMEIDGKPLELFGAGTALFGDIGTRYQCAWSGDVNASANVRLEVVMIDRPADFERYAALIPTRDGDTVIPTAIGDVQVASVIPDGGALPLVTAVLVRSDEQGGIHLVVELLGGAEWMPAQYADLLARLAPTIEP